MCKENGSIKFIFPWRIPDAVNPKKKIATFVLFRCWVTGFGQDAFGQAGAFQRILKEVDLPMVDPFVCEERLRRTRLGEEFRLNQRSFVCAGGIAGKDACTVS